MSYNADTIAAISTANGEGAIGIVRLSGDGALRCAEQIVRLASKQLLSTVASHTIHYGHVYDKEKLVDEVMVTVLRAPRTFTREDVVEINCHGGLVITQKVLTLVLRSGARLAEPGEFTKRAFLNGRIDLSQAEAVMDLIRARTDKALDVAIGQVKGRLANKVTALRQELLQTLAQVEVNIDYPEYDDVEEATSQLILELATVVADELHHILAIAHQGRILREGITTAIIGRPNVGKSSLLNALLQEDKAIVTDIAGTTRDTIEEYVNVGGVPLHLIDTAGIRETEDVVERIGVERSRAALVKAELVLLVLNQSEALDALDKELLAMTKDKRRIIILNKQDLPSAIDEAALTTLIAGSPTVKVSLQPDVQIDALERAIVEMFFAGHIEEAETAYVSNARHIGLLEQATVSLQAAIDGVAMQMPVDLVQIDLTRCWELLGEITGDTVQDALLNELFSQFCLGK